MKNKKVLIIDDNALNRKVFENIIGHNYFFDTANDGFEAIEKIKQENFDIILMDIQMPKLDGISALKIIKEENLTEVPIIAISAYSDQGDRDYFLSTGFNDFIAKPVKPKDLLEIIHHHLHNNQDPLSKRETLSGNEIDESVIKQLLKYHSLENIKTVYKDFLEEAENLVMEIKFLLDSNDYEEIGEKLHILKGNSGTLGIVNFFTSTSKFENKIKSSNFEGIRETYNLLEESLNDFRETIKKQEIFKKYE